MRHLGWMGLFLYAMYKSVINKLAGTLTTKRLWIHGVTLCLSITLLVTVFSLNPPNILPDMILDSLSGLLLYMYRITNWISVCIQLAYLNFVPSGWFPKTGTNDTSFFLKFPGFMIHYFPLYMTILFLLFLTQIVPQIILWLYWKRNWIHILLCVILLFCGIQMMKYHQGYCNWQYHYVFERIRTNVPMDVLYKECGRPITWKLVSRWNNKMRWEGTYTNGIHDLTFVLKEEGTASILGIPTIWMD